MSEGIQDASFALFVYGDNGIARVGDLESKNKNYFGNRVHRKNNDTGGMVSDEYVRQIITQLEKKGLAESEMTLQKASEMLDQASSALSSIEYKLNRIKELAVESADDGSSDRADLQRRAEAFIQDVDDIVQKAKYENNYLLNGSLSDGISSGIYDQIGNELLIKLGSAKPSDLGKTTGEISLNEVLDGGVGDISTQEGAETALGIIDNALGDVNKLKNSANAYKLVVNQNDESVKAKLQDLEQGVDELGDGQGSEKWITLNSGYYVDMRGGVTRVQGVMVPHSMMSVFG